MTKNNTTEWEEKIRFAMAHIEGSDASDVDNMCSLFESLLLQERKDTLESVRGVVKQLTGYGDGFNIKSVSLLEALTTLEHE